jgi:hypothetical protein
LIATVRAGEGHIPKPEREDDGFLCDISFHDGKRWFSAAAIVDQGVEFRDPVLLRRASIGVDGQTGVDGLSPK